MCIAAVAAANTQIAIWSAPNRVALRGTVIVVTSSDRWGSYRWGRPPGARGVIGKPDKLSRRDSGDVIPQSHPGAVRSVA
jgi:hypothetical protein